MSFLTYVFCGTVLYCANILMKDGNPDTDNEDNQQDDINKKKNIITYLLNDMKIRFADKNDYYTVLRVTKKSTPDEIKRAYENALTIYNIKTFKYLFENRSDIDKNLNAFIKCIQTAYNILSDKTSKYYYDHKDIIQDTSNPDDMINNFIDGFVDDFDPTDKASFWDPSELKK